MENPLLLPKPTPSVKSTLKHAVRISFSNISFFAFTFIISLPFLCFLIFYEKLFQKVLFLASEILQQSHEYVFWKEEHITRLLMTKDFTHQVSQLGLLYLLPLHLLQLFTVIITVDLASKIYRQKPISLKEIINTPISLSSLKGTLKTSIYVQFLSTSTIQGLIWLVTMYDIVLSNDVSNVFIATLFGFVEFVLVGSFIVLLKKYLEWSALWNMAIVVSILEDVCGAESFAVSACLNRGSERHGMVLMLIFFVWEIALRIACFFVGCDELRSGIVVQSSLLWMGNVFKWVVCMIYFYNCKKLVLEKKDDGEVGQEVEA